MMKSEKIRSTFQVCQRWQEVENRNGNMFVQCVAKPLEDLELFLCTWATEIYIQIPILRVSLITKSFQVYYIFQKV